MKWTARLCKICIIFLLFTSTSFAQNECGTDQIHQNQMISDPVYRAAYQAMEAKLQTIIKSRASQKTTSQVYTIPVVVHVVHLGEPVGTGTNISDAQINDAIRGANERFRNVMGYGSLDMEINFRLATVDPNGCSTTGIDRVNGSAVPNYTSSGIGYNGCSGASESVIKQLSTWPNTSYYNIWVVKDICNGQWAGYAYYPTSSSLDGTVIGYGYMTYGNATLAHELGHGLNLKHTFEGDGDNAYCPTNTDCSVDGDGCCDTPPQRKNDCSLTSPCTTSGIWGNSLYNYMSYCHYSSERFTPDQKNRVQAAMLISPRSQLVNSLAFTPRAPTAVIIAGDNLNSCQGRTITLNAPAGSSYLWNTGATTRSINVTTTGDYSVSVVYNAACSATSTPVRATFATPLGPLGPISGSTTICPGGSETYSVAPISGAEIYFWTLPPYWTSSANNTSSNSITMTAGNAGGTLYVRAYNSCGSNIDKSLTVTLGSAPGQPGAITGNVTLCPGTSSIYSIEPIDGATSYTWTLPSGWTGTSSTNSITITSGISPGTVSVKANNKCGSSSDQNLNVAVNPAPVQPGAINGNTTVCQGSSETYSVTPVSSATSYTWTLPSGWSGSSSTNTITVTTGTSSGTISVKANNNCGSSSDQNLSVTVSPAPAQLTSISGSTTVCQGSSETYSVSAVNGANSYTWTLPAGWSGSSSTNTITTTIGSSPGNISVKANFNCGSSNNQIVSIAVNSAPAQPGSINGNTTVCQGSSETYSVTPVNGANSYTWTLPPGWTGSSSTNTITVTAGTSGGTVSIRANNNCGSSSDQNVNVTLGTAPAQPASINGNTTVCQGSNETYSVTPVNGATSYTWTLPSGWSGSSSTSTITVTTGTSSGTISVKSNNNCGSSNDQNVSVTVSPAPAQLTSISGNTTVCQGSNQTYSVTPVSGATSYSWTLPSGWTGSSSTNTITTTVGSSPGNISVKANFNCGSSNNQIVSIAVNSAPAQPGSINGNTTVCQGSNETYSVIPVNGATSYTWTLPPGWTGSSSTNTITVTAGTSAGTVAVRATNNCGSSADQNVNVTPGTAPAQPASINGNTTVCQGISETYSVTPVNGATSYTWMLPPGWSGSSSTNTITVTTGSSSGTLSVKANNNCGSSNDQNINVTVTPPPAQLTSINGNATVCQGSNQTYSVTPVNGATSYTWTLPQGWTGSSSTNTITTTVGSSSGAISVKANFTCGSSNQNLNITVNPAPVQPASINGNAMVCPGSSATYSVTPVNGATSYTWTLPQGWTGSSSNNTITVTPGTSGGTISVKANFTCGISSDQNLNVTINPVPVISSQGDTILNSTNAPFYQWYHNNNILTGETAKSLKVNKIGFYRIETSPDKNCWTPSLDFPILISQARLSDTLIVNAYPNPSTGTFNVYVKLQRPTGVIAYISVANATGNIILQTNKLIFFGDELKVPITVSAGIYFVSVHINGDVKTLSVVVQ